HRVRLHPRLSQQPAPRPLLRAGHDRLLPGVAHRGEPLAGLHLGIGGHPGTLPPGLLDARPRGQAGMGLPRPRPGCPDLPGRALPRALAPRLPARRGARGRGRGPLARRAGPPPQGRGHRGQRGAHRHVRHPVDAVRRLRGPPVRLLGGSLGPLLPVRDPRRHRHAPRPVPRGGPDHDPRDVAARALRRHRGRARGDLPDHLRRRAHRDHARRAPGTAPLARHAPASPPAAEAGPVTLLSVAGVTKRFGGITANREVSFDVAAGELVGIIGPNGSGKSTLFEIISGFYRPDAGEVRLDGAPLTGLSPDRVCRLGVARTFQKLRPFAGLTVVDNVMVGALTRTHDVRHARARARELLDRVGLAEKGDEYARTLSTGQRKRLELARALATEPRVLLLDEVTGGVDQRSIPGLVQLVRDLHRGGLTLLVIEHNMRVITAVAQRIVALYLGEKIADDTPDVVTRDPRVVDAYLGQAYTQ